MGGPITSQQLGADHTHSADEHKLTVAVLGLSERGQMLARAAVQAGFDLKAVAGKDPEAVEKASAEHACAGYDDYRQLIIQQHFDCLLVAADIHACEEHLRAAMQRKSDILKLAPLAKDFEQARSLVSLAETEGVCFCVVNPARFRSSYSAAHTMIQQRRIERVLLVIAWCATGNQDLPAWSTDPKLAGGGVLLHDCYDIIDLLLWSFSLPEQVYALKSSQAPDKQQRQYVTEDTISVSMSFGEAPIINLAASRRIGTGPREKRLTFYGADAVLSVTENDLTFDDGTTTRPRRKKYSDDESTAMTSLLHGYIRSKTTQGQDGFCSTAADNLQHMAVMEAAYLSARTGIPEEPARILQRVSGWTPEQTGRL